MHTRLKGINTIFFDYDGTLHNSIKVYAPAFRKAYNYLVEQDLVEKREWSDKEISYWLGFTSKEMWKKFMPDLDQNITKKVSEMIGQEIKRLMEAGEGELYSGTESTLLYLKDKGYHLVFLSNCGLKYRDMVNKQWRLDRFFEELVCAGQYKGIPKYKILEEVMKKYPQKCVMVGDRVHDMEAGNKNDIYTIGCEYGYNSGNELDVADIKIKSIIELKQYL